MLDNSDVTILSGSLAARVSPGDVVDLLVQFALTIAPSFTML